MDRLIIYRNIEFAQEILLDYLIGSQEFLKKRWVAIYDELRMKIHSPLLWKVCRELNRYMNMKVLSYERSGTYLQSTLILKWDGYDAVDTIHVAQSRIEIVMMDDLFHSYMILDEGNYNLSMLRSILRARVFQLDI